VQGTYLTPAIWANSTAPSSVLTATTTSIQVDLGTFSLVPTVAVRRPDARRASGFSCIGNRGDRVRQVGLGPVQRDWLSEEGATARDAMDR
jgi:hypothetical protein